MSKKAISEMSKGKKVQSGRDFGQLDRTLKNGHDDLKNSPDKYMGIIRNIIRNPSRAPVGKRSAKRRKAFDVMEDLFLTLEELSLELTYPDYRKSLNKVKQAFKDKYFYRNNEEKRLLKEVCSNVIMRVMSEEQLVTDWEDGRRVDIMDERIEKFCPSKKPA